MFAWCHCEPFAFCHSDPVLNTGEESDYFAQGKLRESNLMGLPRSPAKTGPLAMTI